jgi:hypothetical protein
VISYRSCVQHGGSIVVIISWNMAKTRDIPFDQVLKRCENWGASVLVVQEPTGSLISFGSDRKTVQPRGCQCSWSGWLQKGGSQGSIVIIARREVSISEITPVDLGTGQGTRRITATNPLVFFQATEGAETMKFATCHSPFDESARAVYSRKAVAEAGERGADCIIGDMNTYGTKVPSGTSSRSSGYQYPPLGPTSARGHGSPLDKVFVADKQTEYLAGRVIPGGAQRGVKRSRETSDNVKDIIDPDWQQCASDHLPIYIAFHDQQCRIENKFFKPPDDDDDTPEPPTKKSAGGIAIPTARPIKA